MALLLSLLTVGENLDAGAAPTGVLTFGEQIAVGLAVGIAGGWLLVTAMQRMVLPSEDSTHCSPSRARSRSTA